MRLHRWRYGILALAVFLALPVVAAEGDSNCGSGDSSVAYTPGTETCLQWFSPENGERKSVVFTHPKECGTELKCALVDGETELALEDCEKLNRDSEVTFENGRLFVKGFPQAEVYCFENEKQTQRIYRAPEARHFCRLANSSYLDKRWDPPFTLYIEGKKANPWGDSNSYCPDPLNHSEAYDYTDWVAGKPAKDLVRRSLLEACSTVVTKYKEACEKKRSVIDGDIGAKNKKKEEDIEKKKRLLMGDWLGWESCKNDIGAAGEFPLKGNCLLQWNLIKDYTAVQLKVTSGEEGDFVTNPSKLDSYFPLKNKVRENMRSNEEETEVNKKWTAGTLDEFLTAQAESSVDSAETNVAITQKNAERQKVEAVVSFLQKRGMNIMLSHSISATKTFSVTDLLRRNSNSTESELTLFQKDEDGRSRNIFDKVIRLVAQVLGSLGVLLLIISAVMMIVSQGEETMLQKAKQTFLYTMIGLVIAFFSYTIVRFLLELLLTR